MKYEYKLASEYFESAIQFHLEIIGISYENLINQKIINPNNKRSENQLLILSKKIVSKAYCLKEQAFSLIYQDFDHMNEVKVQHTQHQQIQESQALLKKSLNTFQIVYNLVLNNEKSFSDIFKIFLIQEIIETLINIKQNKITQNELKGLVQLLDISKNLLKKTDLSFFQIISQRISIDQYTVQTNKSQINEDKFDAKGQINQIQKSRQHFLQGLLEQNQNNLQNAAEQFTCCLEEGINYNRTVRKKAIYHLNYLFSKLPQYKIEDLKSILNEDSNQSLDLVIIIELEYQIQSSTVEQCLKNIKQSNLINSNDRVIILIFHTELDVFMPFASVSTEANWDLIINSVQNIQRIFIQNQNYSKQQLHWSQALIKSFEYIYQQNSQDQLYFDQIYKQYNLIQQNNNKKSNCFIFE
ncbi:tetratricopeptide repeat protein (macronuclear) [Tetrahymena thermophila SB210]|uniref:Tetratricopeptide repeat protein n=1 Tax=Tetrahymena thermophila (strain SB210) TaxID=312017 RepID=W7WZJ5_TETTS|nr:tetratricopeptide repeat protein [Tetrahymena thermophila SB210]EWS71022.1 tetratricopeptide repeat protein [Tetrahymena thermophila SB210]|eukprot:XP_012656443.1 tetratricopeptide repeat protein [Tetrahymena thermophila SB210]